MSFGTHCCKLTSYDGREAFFFEYWQAMVYAHALNLLMNTHDSDTRGMARYSKLYETLLAFTEKIDVAIR